MINEKSSPAPAAQSTGEDLAKERLVSISLVPEPCTERMVTNKSGNEIPAHCGFFTRGNMLIYLIPGLTKNKKISILVIDFKRPQVKRSNPDKGGQSMDDPGGSSTGILTHVICGYRLFSTKA